MRRLALLAALALGAAAFAQTDGALANIPAMEAAAPAAPPALVPEDVAPPLPSADEVVDITPFQKAYDKEIAQEQAQATGAAQPRANRNTSSGGEGMGQLALRATGALAAICAAIIILGWSARRFGGKTPILAGGHLAQVLGRTYLEPKAALHFVKTGGRVLVVGVTPTGMHLITEFEAEQFEQSPEPETFTALPGTPPQAGRPAEANFLAKLREQQERAAAPGVASEELDTLRSDIQRLKQYLQENRRGTGL